MDPSGQLIITKLVIVGISLKLRLWNINKQGPWEEEYEQEVTCVILRCQESYKLELSKNEGQLFHRHSISTIITFWFQD